MVAIITDKMKKQFVQSIIDDVNADSSYYYLTIGKSTVWDDSDTVRYSSQH